MTKPIPPSKKHLNKIHDGIEGLLEIGAKKASDTAEELGSEAIAAAKKGATKFLNWLESLDSDKKSATMEETKPAADCTKPKADCNKPDCSSKK